MLENDGLVLRYEAVMVCTVRRPFSTKCISYCTEILSTLWLYCGKLKDLQSRGHSSANPGILADSPLVTLVMHAHLVVDSRLYQYSLSQARGYAPSVTPRYSLLQCDTHVCEWLGRDCCTKVELTWVKLAIAIKTFLTLLLMSRFTFLNVFGPLFEKGSLCYQTVICLSVCPVCLSVTLVYCGQTVGWIKMKLGMQVGLGPGHIVFDGNSAPLPKGAQPPPPHFRPMSVVAKRLDGSICHLVGR